MTKISCKIGCYFVNSQPRKFEYFILLTIAANCVVLMLEEPLPNGDTTDRNKQLVRNDFNVFTDQRCRLSENSISAQLLRKQPEASTKFKDKNQNSKKNAKRVYVLRLTEIHHHGCIYNIFSWFSAFIFYRKNLKCILSSSTALRLQPRLLPMDFCFIRMRTYEMAGISWILWWLSLGKVFIYLSDSRVCVH